MEVTDFLKILSGVRNVNPGPRHTEWLARCPLHDDRNGDALHVWHWKPAPGDLPVSEWEQVGVDCLDGCRRKKLLRFFGLKLRNGRLVRHGFGF